MKIKITTDTKEANASADRARRLKATGPPLRMHAKTAIIQFLRGVNSRAQMSLPAFYLFIGSNIEGPDSCSVPEYPGTVLTHWMRFSAINTITLCCRMVFDNATGSMTGSVFAKSSDVILEGVAEYWAKRAARPQAEAMSAIALLRDVFRECAKSNGALLDGATTLGKRIGLLKQHADRSAAHISLENYEFSIIDCAHVVGALTIIGEIIRTFDDPEAGPNHFNEIDEAALAAAKAIFPKIPDLRLFSGINIAHHADGCWKRDPQIGRRMLF